MRKVTHLTSVHQATDIRIFEKQCRTLAASGYQVSLVGRADLAETIDGVQIVPVSIPSNRLARMFTTGFRVLRLGLATQADLFHFHDPELIPVGIVLKLLRKKVVYDVHENLPMDILHSKEYIPKWLRKPMAWFFGGIERQSSKLFDVVITVSDSFVKEFPKGKSYVVRNYPIFSDESSVPPPFASRQNWVVFTGGIEVTRCAKEMVRALEHLDDGVQLHLAGPSRSPALDAELATYPGWSRTTNMGMIGRSDVHELLHKSKVGLLMNYPREDYVEISSNKLYEYMLAGVPVVTSDIPSWRRTVEEVGCGVVVDGTDPQSIAEGIQKVLGDPEAAQEMANRGREAASKQFIWESEAKILLAIYANVLHVQEHQLTK